MTKGESPLCETCGVKLIGPYIITECRTYEEKRMELYIPDTGLPDTGPDRQTCINLISFLTTTNLYSHL